MKRYAVLILLAVFMVGITTESQAVNFELKGYMNSVLEYTPENLFTAEQSMDIYHVASLNGNIRLQLRTKGLWNGGSDFSQPVGSFNMDIYNLTVESTGALYPGWVGGRLRIGHLPLNYSPYLLRLDDSPGNQALKRGLSFDGLELGKTNWAGFLFWDGGPWKVAYGGKVEVKNGLDVYRLVNVNYLDATVVTSVEGYKRIQGINDYEKSYSFEMKKVINPQLTVNSIYGWQLHKGIEKTPTIFDLGVSYQFLPEVTLRAAWRNYAPDFKPRYYDRSPRFYEDKLWTWNPIDKYSGQKGGELEINTIAGLTQLEAKYEDYGQEEVNRQKRKTRLMLGGKTTWGGYTFGGGWGVVKNVFLNQNQVTQEQISSTLQEFSLEKPVKIGKEMFLSYKMLKMAPDAYTQTDNYLEHTLQVDGSIGKGVGFSTGVRIANTPIARKYFFLRTTYRAPNGFSFTWNYATPDVLTPTDTAKWYDDFDRYRALPDNLFRVGVSFGF